MYMFHISVNIPTYVVYIKSWNLAVCGFSNECLNYFLTGVLSYQVCKAELCNLFLIEFHFCKLLILCNSINSLFSVSQTFGDVSSYIIHKRETHIIYSGIIEFSKYK